METLLLNGSFTLCPSPTYLLFLVIYTHTHTLCRLIVYSIRNSPLSLLFTACHSCATYSWLISFFDTTASSLKYGTIFAPQQEQKLTGDEQSEPATVPRVMPSRAARTEQRAAGVLKVRWRTFTPLPQSSQTVFRGRILRRDSTKSEEIFL